MFSIENGICETNDSCIVDQEKKKPKWNTRINFNTNYRREMKLKPFNMDYCLLLFDALIFFLMDRHHGGLYLTLIFST